MTKELAEKNLKGLSLDELWTLREKVAEVLLVRIGEQKRTLEDRLRRLERPAGKYARRRHPKVLPRFRNTDTSSQTWAGEVNSHGG